ncbi:MAG: TonB-dependent receptor plug domain-containing protein [Prolixibacteraceae bacterium]
MKILFFIILFFSCSLAIPAQTLIVLDAQNNPVENVVVIGDNFSSHTNIDGILQYFPAEGSTELTFLHPNYKRLNLTWDELVQINFKVVLEQRFREIDEVVIRPLKRNQMRTDVPQKVIVITPTDVQLQQPQTTADLLGTSNEVFVQKSQQGGGSPMIRGFSANRIMLVVDGVRMNNAIYRSGNLQNVISIDATSLEQTEVILGPGSVIYGSDALGGVIQFFTIKPRLSTSELKTPVSAMTRFSSANMEKTGHLSFNLGNQKWASATSFTYSDFDDLKMGSIGHTEYTRPEYAIQIDGQDQIVTNSNPNKQVFTGYNQLNVIQKIRYRPSDTFDFEYAFHYSNTSDIPRYDRLYQYSGTQLKYGDWHYGPQRWIMNSLKADLSVHKDYLDHLTILAAYQDYTESRFDRKLNKTSLNGRTENVDAISLNIDADKYFPEGQSLYYGLEGIYNHVSSIGEEINILTNETERIPSRYPDNSRWWSMAAYAMYHYAISEKTTMQAGGRYNFSGMSGKFNVDDYNFPFDEFSNADGALTANIGLVCNPQEQIRFNTSVSTGFRSPNIDDAAKIFDSEPGNVVVPNPDLEPEYASSFEAGIKWSPSNNLILDATVYYTRLYNAMVRRNGLLNGQDSILYDGEMSKVEMITNASWANMGGVSLHFQAWNRQSFSMKGGVNWQKGMDSDDFAVRHIAPLFGDLHAAYTLSKMKFDLYLLFNGEIAYENLAPDERSKPEMYASDENGNPYSPPWWTLNLKGTLQISKMINLNAGIENILDKRYRPYSSGIAAPGLNFIFSVNFKI